MPEKYINPYTDFGFMRIFGQEANKDILIAFLNSLLPEHHQIADLEFRNNEQTPLRHEIYTFILDLYCVTPSGERFIVEMQQKYHHHFMDRSVSYTAAAIRNMVERGERSYALPAVYYIGILDFVHHGEGWTGEVIQEVSLKNQNGVVMYDKLRMYFIQLPLFAKKEDELVKPIDKWLYFLKYLQGFQRIPEVLGEPVFEKAFEVAALSAMSESEQYAHEKAWDDMVTTRGIWEYGLEGARAEGLAEGRAEGEAQGRAQGRAEGEAQGRAEGEAQGVLKTARNMLALGIPLETIAQATGLAEADIRRMQ